MSNLSINVSESLNKFFTVSNSNSGFAADDVVNMKADGARKAGTFRGWNVFRRVGRSDAEIRANNDTRQRFLDSLKETFGLSGEGKVLVDQLAAILGKDAFKPEDYEFDGQGKLKGGKPLTARRITAVSEAVTWECQKAEKAAANRTATYDAANYLRILLEHSAEKIADKLGNDWGNRNEIENVLSNVYDHLVIEGFEKPQYAGLSTALSVAFVKAGIPDLSSREKLGKLVDDIIKLMKQDSVFADAYENHDKLVDEYFALSGQDRQRTENLAVSSKVVARKVEEADARKATSENLRKFVNGMEKVGTAAGELRYFIGHNGSELGSMLKSLTEADPKIDSKAIENILSNVYILSDNAVPADLIGLSTALRISIEKARVFPGKPPEGMNQKDWDAARETKRDKLAGDILSILKDNKRFAEVYGQHERLLDEHYQNSGKERKKMEDQAFSRNAALAGLA